MMSNPIHQHEGYMAHMHVKELDFLKRISVEDGVLVYHTGTIIQPVNDRIQMYEEMIERSPDTYADELKGSGRE